MDELNAISWNKGCYMGQELTARTRYQGLVRKRLIPGKFSGAETLPFLSPLLWKDKEIGTLRSSESGFGIALVRLEALKECLEAQNSFKIQSTEETSTPPTWTPFIPQFLEKIFESA
jgi:folate-binding Fe-S cluster repair protein YgfZ